MQRKHIIFTNIKTKGRPGITKISKSGLGLWLNCWERWLLFQKIWRWFPAPQDSSQPSVASAPGLWCLLLAATGTTHASHTRVYMLTKHSYMKPNKNNKKRPSTWEWKRTSAGPGKGEETGKPCTSIRYIKNSTWKWESSQYQRRLRFPSSF